MLLSEILVIFFVTQTPDYRGLIIKSFSYYRRKGAHERQIAKGTKKNRRLVKEDAVMGNILE